MNEVLNPGVVRIRVGRLALCVQRASLATEAAPHFFMLKGGFAITKSARAPANLSSSSESPSLTSLVMPWMARFIRQMRQVAWLFSWPRIAIFCGLPPCALTNSADWTNRPPDPHAGSSTRPSNGSSISTSNRVTEAGV